MTLEKAIRDLQARVDGEFSIKGIDNCEDMKLGIQAMNYIKRSRDFGEYPVNLLLPGETKE